ncbi:hypothetical protein AgCh_016170 [Apium graveolens]
MNRQTQEFWGMNMLLIDDSNTRIHAYASAKCCVGIEKDLVEGRIYIISNFKVKDFLGDETYCPVKNKKHIYFTKDTKIHCDTDEGFRIEKYAFDLFNMSEIEKLASDNRFLVDMVGILKNRRPIMTSNKNSQEKHMLKFDLDDGKNSVPVTLFDAFALFVNKVMERLGAGDVIVVICCAKVNRYEGKPHLTNYPATRIFINPDHYCVDLMKNRDDELSDIDIGEEELIGPMLNLKEIAELTEEHIETEVCCELLVDKLDRVKKCFCLEALCSDQAGSVTIVLPHSSVVRIAQKNVEDLYSPEKEELGEHFFPPFLQLFERKKYVMTILISEQNIRDGSTVYEATEIGDVVDSSGQFTPSGQETVDQHVYSPMNIPVQTPPTAKSANSKVRSRKGVPVVQFDEYGEIGTDSRHDKKKKAK